MTLDDLTESGTDEAPGTSGAGFPQGWRIAGGLVAIMAGFGLGLGGLVLHFAEKAGRVAILPFPIAIFGRLTMVIGLGAVGLGAWLAGRRAAMVLSVLMIPLGLAVYAVGIVYVEQFGNRICQALGLLTVLVGLMSIWMIHGISKGEIEGDGKKATPASEFGDGSELR
jgi:hypothetical protein